MNTFDQVMDWLQSARKFGVKPGLDRMELVLSTLQHPEKKLRCIHIGGTNGKGSTVTYLRNILQTAGYSVGTFTSPYVVRFEERISLNGEPIHQDDFVRAAQTVRDAIEQTDDPFGPATEFEILTLISFVYFESVAPDFVIYEVGLGGRLDSTNVIFPRVSAITNVGMDHMHILGDHVEAIANEKAGIIKPRVPFITSVTDEPSLEVIKKKAADLSAPITRLNDHFHVTHVTTEEEGSTFSLRVQDQELLHLRIYMRGRHQVDNAALAVSIALEIQKMGHQVSEEAIKSGLIQSMWPGRLEKVKDKPFTLIDGAHNPEGIESLVRYMQPFAKERPIHVIAAVTKEKDVNEMYAPLLSLQPASFILTSFNHERCANPIEVAETMSYSGITVELDNQKAYNNVKRVAKETDVILITGSLFFISEMRAFLTK
ncbi:folylpolyglutamate synthase/dihydrofolate synthase family protein [Geomicrobium sp. JSM 1781026]|uniref:bifunctional folylpolyglutamate synthase/dihydrofolate synthase n=1 Tax=Geomicrobium sp. JSM 1781026 TaxID=3344580 RepID=UPI0035BF398F